VIASRTDAYLRNSIRAVYTRLSESVERMLRGPVRAFRFERSENQDLFPVMLALIIEGLAIGAEVRKERVIEQVLDAAKTICGVLFTPRSAG
jgi:hypothetical protein